MCSIFGIHSGNPDYLSSEEAISVIKTLKNEMDYRGPDSFGIKFIMAKRTSLSTSFGF